MRRVIKYITNIYNSLIKKDLAIVDESILLEVHKHRGVLWEKIESFRSDLANVNGSASHKPGEYQSNEMKDLFPLDHHIESGLYTREVFMPKGSIVVSFIHKQNHPSFVLEGEASVLLDNGDIARYKQGDKIMTKIGTQRVLFMHEDTRWVCVYRTDKKTVLEAEKDVYADTFTELPKSIISQNKLLWQEKQQELL